MTRSTPLGTPGSVPARSQANTVTPPRATDSTLAAYVRSAAASAGLTTAADIAAAAGWTRRYLYRVLADPAIFDLRRLAQLDRALNLPPGSIAAHYYATQHDTRKDTTQP